VSHFEICGDDPDKLAQFYMSLFDWSIEPMPAMDYRLIRTVDTDANGGPVQAGGINGGMLCVLGFRPGAWVNYVNVESVDGSLARAEARCEGDEGHDASARYGLVRDDGEPSG
jgi:uncharacterized protein